MTLPAQTELRFSKLAYTVVEFAEACGVGETTIRDHITAENLTPIYPNSKAIIPLEEGLRWLRTLPKEKP